MSRLIEKIIVLLIYLFFSFVSIITNAAPQGGQPVEPVVISVPDTVSIFSPDNVINTISVDGTSVLNWDSFNINQNEMVNFNLSTSEITLNRIFNDSNRVVFGTINNNDQILLINPNGLGLNLTTHIDVNQLTPTAISVAGDINIFAGSQNDQDLTLIIPDGSVILTTVINNESDTDSSTLFIDNAPVPLPLTVWLLLSGTAVLLPFRSNLSNKT